MTRKILGLLAAVSLTAATGCNNPTVAELSVTYFNLVDSGTFTYTSEAGLTETHEYARDTEALDDDGRHVFSRTARRGGFLQDDATVTFEATEDRQLLMTRYYDCVTRCGDLSEPVEVFGTWPVEAGAIAETTTVVTLTRNGEDDGQRVEEHRFAVGEESTVETGAGSFESAFTVVWTRTIEDESASAALVFVPENGFIVVEDFSGQRFELESGPLPEEEDAQ